MGAKKKDVTKKLQGFTDFPKVIGNVLESYNSLEERLDEIILNYFNPNTKREDFKNILLNSSVVGLGAKCKLFSNMKGFDQKIVEKIRRIGSIRNGIAHNNALVSVHIEPNENQQTTIIRKKNIIQVMNSSGIIKDKELETEYHTFLRLHEEVSKYIQQFQRDQ